MHYYASFVPGMQEIIAGVLRERLADVSIVRLLDGAVIFETEAAYDRLNFFCFNNIFAVIDIMEHRDHSPAAKYGGSENEKPLESHIRKICGGVKISKAGRDLPKKFVDVISNNSKKIKTFRLVCSLENKPAAVGKTAKQEIENLIKRNSGLIADRSNPDTEFWFLYRREGFSVFMKRLTRSAEKKLRDGELPPQLAWLLCRAAALGPGETVADPFCGFGAIPEATVKHFPVDKFYALDTDPRCVSICLGKKSLQSARCEIREADFFAPPDFLPWGELDAIVTDPPWGLYKETRLPLAEFYDKTLTLFIRLLKPGGRAVVLAGNEFRAAVQKTPSFKREKTIPILVAGKKASVFILRKSGN